MRNLAAEKYTSPQRPKFQFHRTIEAANENWNVLKQYKNLGAAIEAQQNSILQYGSEFCPIKSLEPLLKNHPLWPRLRISLSTGVEFLLEPTTTEQKLGDVVEALDFGNHKGAQKYKEFFEKCLEDDVTHGFSLVLPKEAILQIPNALLAPLNVHNQNTINERGEIIDKKRLTHNQSMKYKNSGTSLNSRLRTQDLQACMYGHCLLRVIHAIVSLRQQHKKLKIFLSKLDFKSAYRRLHYAWKTAIQSATCHESLVYIALRLTFGGSACPSEWSNISETIVDVAANLLNCEEWNPLELQAPITTHIPEDRELPANIPYGQALSTVIDPKIPNRGSCDVYLDDSIVISPDLPGNRDRARGAIALAIHAVGRPLAENETVPRNHLISKSKLKAEAALTELLIMLGWLLNTRQLLIQLPDHKWSVWRKTLVDMIKKGKTTFDEMETVVGRLTHLVVVLQYVLHF